MFSSISHIISNKTQIIFLTEHGNIVNVNLILCEFDVGPRVLGPTSNSHKLKVQTLRMLEVSQTCFYNTKE